MFVKCALAKFEWEGMPDDIDEIFIENLLLHSSDDNFVVCEFEGQKNKAANGEWWGYYEVQEREPKYGVPTSIMVTNYNGGTYRPKSFVLFSRFKNTATLNINYINAYSQMMAQINKALRQHINATQLIATIYAASKAEKDELTKLFCGFDGVKIVQHKKDPMDDSKKFDIVQFEIEPRGAELEDLKHNLEKDLFLRLGIDYGTDKTHITNANLKDSEQPIDLINAYELKRRENFCKRYNAWWKERGQTRNLSVKIHTIRTDNSIQQTGGESSNDDERNQTDSD